MQLIYSFNHFASCNKRLAKWLEVAYFLLSNYFLGGRVHVKEHKGDRIHMGAQWIHQFCPENTMVQVAKK